MKKIEFDESGLIKVDEKFIESLINNKRVIKFLNDHNLDADIVRRYPFKFSDWLDQLEVCDKCSGLKNCSQKIQGKIFELEYDGFITMKIVPCKYTVEDTIKKTHLKNFVVNDLSEYMRYVDFSIIDSDKENNKYLKSIGEVLDCLDDRTYGLFLYGNMGSGKTFIAACAANKLAKENMKVAFVNLPLFSQRIKGLIENSEYQTLVDQLVNVEFLVVDDIGAESVTSWFRDEILFTILNERMENKRWTWFTSNEDLNSLKHHFEINNKNVQEKIKAERIMQRIQVLSKSLEIVGNNRRKI